MLNDYILSKEEQENIQDIAELNAIYDLMLGKPIPGEWLPWGPKRDPDTAEDPEVARKLLKKMEDFQMGTVSFSINDTPEYVEALDHIVSNINSITQHNEEMEKFKDDTIKQQFS